MYVRRTYYYYSDGVLNVVEGRVRRSSSGGGGVYMPHKN